MDDFGTGLSSFSYLKHLKVDVLKLDGVFIRDLLEDQRNEAMVTAFTQLAGAYGLTTVAEFVSNDALRQRLARLGVDFAQGYTVGRPQPLEEVLAGAPPVLG
ncbi:MAG: EAL domain-containing protein [Arhodomonas sp.]|nr:EAL domain-containing protein [Arhodomonas sp.]